jgi:hypothetical protein
MPGNRSAENDLMPVAMAFAVLVLMTVGTGSIPVDAQQRS